MMGFLEIRLEFCRYLVGWRWMIGGRPGSYWSCFQAKRRPNLHFKILIREEVYILYIAYWIGTCYKQSI